MRAFMNRMDTHHNAPIDSYDVFWQWSLDNPTLFWNGIVTDVALMADDWGDQVLVNGEKMPGAQFYPGAKLNYAQNMLRYRGPEDAIVFWGEDKVKRRLSRNDVFQRVSKLAQALRAEGVETGDRIAGYMPNLPETVIACLAAATLGATWSSCSPDFGVQGVLDRFGQIEPTVLFSVDGYHYNGKHHDLLGKVRDVVAQLPTLKKVVITGYLSDTPDVARVPGAVTLDDYVAAYEPERVMSFEQVPFNHPLFIMYSSGTTGVPKCIVHGTGGTLVQHLKEHHLHCDVSEGDKVFYFTTCGWMMWNWQITAMALGATLMLYDGSPFYPDGTILWDYAQAEKHTLFGTSAKYLDALNKGGIKPSETHDLTDLRTIASTGSPLVAEGFDYVYKNIKADVHLASIAGGTDIIACFIGGSPMEPVWRGEIQRPLLGMAVDVFDDNGNSVHGDKGELVCTKPFPSMPIGFWNDPDGARYKAAYFERFENIWHHGDYVAMTEHGGIVMYGRSDATLNPGGVRIGTAEIYRQVEKLEAVQESIVIGQDWDDDVRVILFIILRDGRTLDDDLRSQIKKQIRDNCTPRHVPARIIQVADIPRTKSGKITELAVRDIVHGKAVKNSEALANPEALNLYRDLPDLQT